MKKQFKILLQDCKNSVGLFSLPILLSLTVFLLVWILIPGEVKAARFGDMAQEILLFAFLLWPILILRRWISGDEIEALRSIEKGRHACAAELIGLLAVEAVWLLLIWLMGRLAQIPLEGECFRLLALSALMTAVLYLLSVLLRSVAFSTVAVAAYCLLSIILSSNSNNKKWDSFFLVNPGRGWRGESTEAILKGYMPVLAIALLCILCTSLIERRNYKRRW